MQKSPPGSRLLVAAAVITDDDGRYLVTRRREGAHLGGLWEFPGGVVEADESPDAALVRELGEELGVTAAVGPPLTFAWHRDDQRDVVLLFFLARLQAGTPHGCEGQEVRWVTADELTALRTPPADAALIGMLCERPSRDG